VLKVFRVKFILRTKVYIIKKHTYRIFPQLVDNIRSLFFQCPL